MTKEMSKREQRVVRRLERRKFRRDLICTEVRANDGYFAQLRGKSRHDMTRLAERHELQRVRITTKRETRQRLAAMTPKERAKARELGQRQFQKHEVTL